MGPEALGGCSLTAGALFSLYHIAPLPAQRAESSGLCPSGIVLELAWEQRQADISWNRAWGRGSPGATGKGGQRPWSAAGAGRTRAAQGGNPIL